MLFKTILLMKRWKFWNKKVTPLQLACSDQTYDIANLLILKGANVNDCDIIFF